jgi:hypothetical protein
MHAFHEQLVRLLLVGCCASSVVGCCAPSPMNPPALMAVREEVSRSRSFALPLDDASRQGLLMFLAAGGNNDGIEDDQVITLVYPDAEVRFGPLLAALSQPANVDLADMSNGTYAAWLKGAPLRHVVDARDPRPNLACPPFAFSQDRFVWIFKCGGSEGGQQKLAAVFVQQAVAPRTESP